MGKNPKIDQPNKKVSFGGAETMKFNSNDAPEKASKINFSSAKDVKRNSSHIMSGLMETQFKENDFSSGYMQYGAKLAKEGKNQDRRNVKDIKSDFEKNKEQNWQARTSEQKNNQKRTR